MDSKPELSWYLFDLYVTDFANFRVLTTSYLRGEIDLQAFTTIYGELMLRHDMYMANHKMQAQISANAESGSSGAGKHRLGEPEYHWPAPDVPEVDLEESCMAPATHDGSGDCGCPAIGED